MIGPLWFSMAGQIYRLSPSRTSANHLTLPLHSKVVTQVDNNENAARYGMGSCYQYQGFFR